MTSITPDDVASLAAKYDAFLASLTEAEVAAFNRVIHVAIEDEDRDVEGFGAPSFATVFDAPHASFDLPDPGGAFARTSVPSRASNLMHVCATGKHFPSVSL